MSAIPAVDAGPASRAAVDTLYYDGSCPLCAAEIDQLREARGEQLSLVDIHSLRDSIDANATEALLRSLHLRRADGSWLTGADANVAAWEGTARWRWLRALRWPLLRHAVDGVYTLWAGWRYRRLYRR